MKPSGTGNPTKKETQHNVDFAKGGTTHMFGQGDRTTTATKDSAGDQTAGQTASESKNDQKFASGGSTKMFGYHPAVPASAGITGPR